MFAQCLARRKQSTGGSSNPQNPSHITQADAGAELTWFPFSVVTCEAQEAPEHGSLVCTHPLGNFSYTSACSASCEEGYVPRSSEATRCTSSGEWSGPAPACNGKALLGGSERSPILPSAPRVVVVVLSNLSHFQNSRENSRCCCC